MMTNTEPHNAAQALDEHLRLIGRAYGSPVAAREAFRKDDNLRLAGSAS